MKVKLVAGIIAVLTFSLTASLASAAQPEQSHDLSEINPIDTDFDLSGYQVFNAHSFAVQNGLNLSGNTFYDQGNVKILEYDSSNNKWSVLNSDLDLNGNNLIQPNQIRTGGQNIQVRDTANGQDVARFNEGGNVEIPNGNLDMSGNGKVFGAQYYGTEDGARFRDAGTNAVVRSGGNAVILENNTGDTILRANNDGNFDVEIPNGNLDLSGNNITSINTLHFLTGMQINGSINTSGGDTNLGGGSINDVGSIDGGGDSVRFDDSIDLNGNNLVEPNQIQTGGQNIQIRDTSNGQDVARFQEGGNIEIPNGNLKITESNGNIQDGGGTDRIGISSSATQIYDEDGNPVFTAAGSNSGTFARIRTRSGQPFQIRDVANSQQAVTYTVGNPGIFELKNANLSLNGNKIYDSTGAITLGGGNVEIPNGNLDMSGNTIDNVGGTSAASNGAIKIVNGKRIAWRNNAGDGDIAMSVDSNDHLNIGVAGNVAQIDLENADVNIPNGDLNINGNTLQNIGGLTDSAGTVCGDNQFIDGNGNCQTDDNTDGDTSSSNEIQTLSEVLNQGNKTGGTDIDLDGGRLVDSTGTTTLGDGNVEIPDGDLNIDDQGKIQLNDNNGGAYPLIEYRSSGILKFNTQWSSDDNAYVIRDKDDSESGGTDVLRATDSNNVEIPNGDLDMKSNNIQNVGSSDVDMVHDSSDNRMEIRSNGNTDICIGNC